MSALDERLTAAHAEVKAEIARTDTKTGLLLAFTGAVLAGAVTTAKGAALPAGALVVGSLGVAVLVAAAAVLLSAVRPNLSGRHGFPHWATLDADGIRAALAAESLEAEIAGLARIAVLKFRALQRGVDLLRSGGALLVVAALVAAGGAM